MSIFEKLAAEFPRSAISWRVGSTNADKTRGLALAYLDARDVMQRLDDAAGPGNWQVRYPWSDGKRLCCEIGLRDVNGEWIWRSNGAGESDIEPEKGAFSDSFKRAAVLWGIGRYLYALASPWVPLVQRGRSYVIADGVDPWDYIDGKKPPEPVPARSAAPPQDGPPLSLYDREPGLDEDELPEPVYIQDVKERQKSQKTGKYGPYKVVFSNKKTASTFDEKVAAEAKVAQGANIAVVPVLSDYNATYKEWKLEQLTLIPGPRP